MIYLKYFWILLAIFLVSYILASSLKWQWFTRNVENFGILFFIGLGSLLFVAIATKDPVSVAGINIPAELQWLGSLFITGFGAWKFYLNPLKVKVYSMDREIGEIKGNLNSINTDVNFIKTDINLIKTEVNLIKTEVVKKKGK